MDPGLTTMDDNRINENSNNRSPALVELYPNNAQGAAVLFFTAVCATILPLLGDKRTLKKAAAGVETGDGSLTLGMIRNP